MHCLKKTMMVSKLCIMAYVFITCRFTSLVLHLEAI